MPAFDLHVGMQKTEKPAFIEAFVLTGVRRRIRRKRSWSGYRARSGIVARRVCVRPRDHDFAAELFPVVATDNRRVTAMRPMTRATPTRDGALHLNGHSLVTCVVDDGQGFDDASFDGPIKDEVDGPHFVCRCRPDQWMPVGQGQFLSLVSTHLRFHFLIQALDRNAPLESCSGVTFPTEHSRAPRRRSKTG